MSVTYIHTYLKLLEGEEAFVEGEDGVSDFLVGVFEARECDCDVVRPLHV